ncbi:MOB kinase activator 1B-like [Fundulus heteroclitus]|uniref:MOB kinase activator 1B-like n=1 Tax=Fundulus heteroclitus TaxID=8078 RepID=UPI00165AF5C2|nr:MOB kinase activator 1B-like [Fundulus heteroclitus]
MSIKSHLLHQRVTLSYGQLLSSSPSRASRRGPPPRPLSVSSFCFHLLSSAVDFFNQINMLYGTITDFCTEESCPVMSAGPKYEYHWADGTNIKKPIKCSAPKYIDYLMTWVQDQLDDETLFPSKIGVPFKRNFMSVAKTILKRLFRVYAHIYHQHFDSVMQLQEEAHLNTSFKHFIFFVQEFNLIDRKELAPLQELIEKLTTKDR